MRSQRQNRLRRPVGGALLAGALAPGFGARYVVAGDKFLIARQNPLFDPALAVAEDRRLGAAGGKLYFLGLSRDDIFDIRLAYFLAHLRFMVGVITSMMRSRPPSAQVDARPLLIQQTNYDQPSLSILIYIFCSLIT